MDDKTTTKATLVNTNTWYDDFQVWLTEEQSLHNAQLVANHFSGSDWTRASLSAMLGNMRHESSINPNMYEYGYAWEDDRGYGLVQWTPRSKYWDWAVANGLPPERGESQLARIDYEIENDIQWIANGHGKRYGREEKYNISFAQFRANTEGYTLAQLTEAFMWNYEGPNYEAGLSSLPGRIAFAELAYDTLDFDGAIPGPPGGDQKLPYFVIRRHSTNMRRMGVRGRR